MKNEKCKVCHRLKPKITTEDFNKIKPTIEEIKTLRNLQEKVFIGYELNGYKKRWNYPKENGLPVYVQRIFDIAELGLVGTEISEAQEELRKHTLNRDVLASECADIIIRVLDFMSRNKLDLEIAIYKMNNKELSRGFLHGKAV